MELKYGDKARAIGIAEANHDLKQAIRLRKQIVKIQDILKLSLNIQKPSY